MKKLFAILLVVLTVGAVLGGCSKPADDATTPAPEKSE